MGDAFDGGGTMTLVLLFPNRNDIKLSKTDTVTLSDAVTKKAMGMIKADTATLSDAVVKSFATPRSDTITLSDAPSKKLGLNKADTVTLSDAISRVWTILRSLTDTVTLSDSLSRVGHLILSDIVTLSDSIGGLFNTLSHLPAVIATTLSKGFGMSRAEKPSGMTKHSDKGNIV